MCTWETIEIRNISMILTLQSENQQSLVEPEPEMDRCSSCQTTHDSPLNVALVLPCCSCVRLA